MFQRVNNPPPDQIKKERSSLTDQGNWTGVKSRDISSMIHLLDVIQGSQSHFIKEFPNDRN